MGLSLSDAPHVDPGRAGEDVAVRAVDPERNYHCGDAGSARRRGGIGDAGRSPGHS